MPGPGSYDVQDISLKKMMPKTRLESNFAYLKIQSPPSIPSHESVFGYEEANHGILIKQSNPDKIHRGEKGDTIGPGQYNVPSSFSTSNNFKGLSWQRSKSKRELYNLKSKPNVDFITPRDYNIFPIYKFKNSSVFASKVPRMDKSDKMKVKFGKRGSLSAPKILDALTENESDDEGVPGPGFYYNPAQTSDFAIEPYTGRNQYFGSTVERFQQMKVKFNWLIY
jgi:hypothetical protein